MVIALFIVCVLLCGLLALAYLERRELREDYRKIVNEWSIRTGGRQVYKPEAKQLVSEPQPDRDEFRILTPSMAEVESMESDERAARNGEMSEEDKAHLRKMGVMIP